MTPPPNPILPLGKTRTSVVQTNTEDPPTPNLQRMFWDQRQQSSHVCGCRHSPEQSAALVHQKSMALHTAAPPPPPPEGKGSEDTVYGSVGQRTAGRERCCQHEWILRCNPQSPPSSSSGRMAASSAAEKRSGSSHCYTCVSGHWQATQVAKYVSDLGNQHNSWPFHSHQIQTFHNSFWSGHATFSHLMSLTLRAQVTSHWPHSHNLCVCVATSPYRSYI